MDLERLKKVQSARSQFVEAANSGLPEAQEGMVDELEARFRAVAERMAKYVGHQHYEPVAGSRYKQLSAPRHIGKFDGPMPEVSVRFGYMYKYKAGDGVSPERSQGIGVNEHGENIKEVWIEWIHAPEGVTEEPIKSSGMIPAYTLAGEVFATEALALSSIDFLRREELDEGGLERLWGHHPSVSLRLIEESLDQYEAAPPSVYELRESTIEA